MSERVKIETDDGKQVEATAPVIISASRSTDIPAFYAKWFFNRLAKGIVPGIILLTSKRCTFLLSGVA